MSEHIDKPTRKDRRTGKHIKKLPSDLMSAEERAQMSRENGAKYNGDKHRGISNAERAAIQYLKETGDLDTPAEALKRQQEAARQDRWRTRHDMSRRANEAAEKLGKSGFRIRGEIRGQEAREAATTLGEVALVQMANALTGRISKDKINAVLKATLAVREEVCDPLVKEQKITGALTLEQMVSQAGQRARAMLDTSKDHE